MAHGFRENAKAVAFRIISQVSPPRAASWQPPVDVFLTSEKIVVVLEAAGVNPENLDITFADGTLQIRGFRPRPVHGMEPRSFLHMEIPHGFFERVVALPEKCDEENISAVYRDGMIVIEVPLGETSSGREIPIE